VEYDREKNLGTLRWTPNPTGRKPVAYRIYASDEKGFSISDEPFQVAGGLYDLDRKTAGESPTRFPVNFLIETAAAEAPVIGEEVVLAGANKAHYRVVAVDENGNRSGPSDYATAPRPVIYSKPVTRAKIGVEYAYEVRAVRSIGDLRMRMVDGREATHYWDVEKPRFRLEQGPAWLTIDAATGRLSGTPDRSGRAEAIVSVSLVREVRRLDPAQLQWGVEKVLETGIETVGAARQRFVVETIASGPSPR
jgi:hypothetical protein